MTSLRSSILDQIMERLANAEQGVAPNTESEYRRIIARLPDLDWRAAGIERGWSKRTLRVHRAACRWKMAVDALSALSALSALEGDEETPLTSEFGFIHRAASAIRALASDLARDEDGETADAIARTVSRTRKGKKPKKRSKRTSLSELPSDWAWQLVAEMPTEHDKLVTMVAIATGCRPQELRLGIGVTRLDGCRVRFWVRGAKVSDRTGGGQLWREQVVDVCEALGSLATEFLACLPGPDQTLLVDIQGGGWQKKLERRARRLGWPKVSAYSLRHQLASVLKDDNEVDGNVISQVLGHASDRSRRRYGMSRYGGGGGHGIESVEAAVEVRQHDDAPAVAEAAETDGGMHETEAPSTDQPKEQSVGPSDDALSDDDLLGDFDDSSGPSLGM